MVACCSTCGYRLYYLRLQVRVVTERLVKEFVTELEVRRTRLLTAYHLLLATHCWLLTWFKAETGFVSLPLLTTDY